MIYEWAFNKLKLQQSELALKKKRELNPALVIDEPAIKAEYIARGGLLTEDKPEIEVDPVTKAVRVKHKDLTNSLRVKIAEQEAEIAKLKEKKKDK